MKTMQEKFDDFEDRHTWPAGPWDDEPDKIQWADQETGLPCLLIRNRFGALCGYVGVLPTHQFYGKDYADRIHVSGQEADSLEVDEECPPYLDMLIEALTDRKDGTVPLIAMFKVHGGLTFSDRCNSNGKICHAVEPPESDDVWWFGFDCAHDGDLSPGLEAILNWLAPPRTVPIFEKYRNVEYVQRQCRSLAKQLAACHDFQTRPVLIDPEPIKA